MVMCFVPLCKHYSEQKTCNFFLFPSNPVERKTWINLIRRKDREPSKYSLVCSCHFIDQNRKNRPTIFDFNAERKLAFTSPEKRRRKSQRMSSTAVADPSTEDLEDLCEPEPSTNQPTTSDDFVANSGASLQAENYFLNQKIDELSQKLKKLSVSFSYEHIKTNDSHILMYTGIPSNTLFMLLYETMANIPLNYYANWNVQKISKIDQLLMTLMKLRLNLPHEDLALRFNCSAATITNIIMTWIYALHEIIFKQLMKSIPPRSKNQTCLPGAFETFKNCRIILDCTEIHSATPSSMENQRLTYSSYKHGNTWKLLVGVAPNGVVTYVSKAYPGSTSDKKIVGHCKVLEQMVSGDLVLADKGFLIRDLLLAGVSLNIPPFLSTPQFTEAQVLETKRIASARIHVERAIRRIKCYNILQRIPQFYMNHISVLFQTCAALTNFQYPLIKEVEDYY